MVPYEISEDRTTRLYYFSSEDSGIIHRINLAISKIGTPNSSALLVRHYLTSGGELVITASPSSEAKEEELTSAYDKLLSIVGIPIRVKNAGNLENLLKERNLTLSTHRESKILMNPRQIDEGQRYVMTPEARNQVKDLELESLAGNE